MKCLNDSFTSLLASLVSDLRSFIYAIISFIVPVASFLHADFNFFVFCPSHSILMRSNDFAVIPLRLLFVASIFFKSFLTCASISSILGFSSALIRGASYSSKRVDDPVVKDPALALALALVVEDPALVSSNGSNGTGITCMTGCANMRASRSRFKKLTYPEISSKNWVSPAPVNRPVSSKYSCEKREKSVVICLGRSLHKFISFTNSMGDEVMGVAVISMRRTESAPETS